MPDTSPPPEPLSQPPEPLRRVDWLAVAPWLLLLRAPGVTFGWPLLLGALGTMFVLGGLESDHAADLGSPVSLLRVAADRLVAFPADVLGAFRETFANEEFSSGRRALRLVGMGLGLTVWGVLGLVIVDHAARRLTDSRSVGSRAVWWRAVKRLPTLLGLFAFLAVVVWLGLWLWPLILRSLWLDAWTPIAVLSALGGGVALLISTGLVLLLGGLLLAAPLLWPAIVVDDADAFDTVSRAFAYATQRLGRLIGYVAVAGVLGVLSGALVEAVTIAALNLSFAGFPPLETSDPAGDGWARNLLGFWSALFDRAARGFYPAYWFVATTGVYLLLRRDVDGQPLDEMTLPRDQPADAA
ncbi:hypothetical protein MalM25_06090 [Planctomycetes bacterium MalM25]|nr:hypothetical protein MalM25_06090 [Planctomycetes bacterium MalM25]